MKEYQKYVPLKPNIDLSLFHYMQMALVLREGMNDAQSAGIHANSAWQQLQGLEMTIQEWYKRCILLQDICDELYRSSGRDRRILYQLKHYFIHQNVTSNVKDSFNFNEEFLDFCCNGYTVIAAMHYMQTKHLSDTPSDFPKSLQNKLIYIDHQDIPGSDMICCENRNCDRGIWFHLECIEMDVENVPDGSWFCSNDCKTSL
ncbi:hypothetical protein ACJMK2_002475 [Sinanodonta woodiana]|uniref:Zinc finger PHD-type domain-containing protein n=1 Tax=Sinanodonta woodiana TaxID=1069815 RepID=A0ABD3XYW0_SINWO